MMVLCGNSFKKRSVVAVCLDEGNQLELQEPYMLLWRPLGLGSRDLARYIDSHRRGRLNIEKHAVCNAGISTTTQRAKMLSVFSSVRPSCQDTRIRWQRGGLYILSFLMGLPSV
jgi:hypothetical protein